MSSRSADARDSQLNATFQEYNALYQLVIFRLNALDKRAPVTVAAFAAVLVSVQSLPISSQLLVLLFLPPSLIWLMRTTVNHARSFEDALRRIEVLEQSVNLRLDAPIMGFQSQHPSRGREVGGRTGRESVQAVLGSILLLLLAAGYQMHVTALLSGFPEWVYDAGLLVIAALSIQQRVQLSSYRYRPVSG